MGNSITTAVKKTINKINPWAEEESNDDGEIVKEIEPKFLRIVERKEWNPRKPKWRRRLKTPVDLYLLRYFSNTPDCEGDEECFDTIKNLQEEHMRYGLPDIAYNFLVAKDGTVYEGRGWTDKPTKMDYSSMSYHGKTIDIAYIGDYKEIYPSPAMDSAVCRLMQKGADLGHSVRGFELIEVRKDTSLETGNTGPWNREELENDQDEKIYDEQQEIDPEPSS